MRPFQPAIQGASGGPSPELKRRGHETIHSFLSSAEIRNKLNLNSTPSYSFMWCTKTTLVLPLQLVILLLYNTQI
jgi:hypothetical protein